MYRLIIILRHHYTARIIVAAWNLRICIKEKLEETENTLLQVYLGCNCSISSLDNIDGHSCSLYGFYIFLQIASKYFPWSNVARHAISIVNVQSSSTLWFHRFYIYNRNGKHMRIFFISLEQEMESPWSSWSTDCRSFNILCNSIKIEQ